MRLRHLRLLPWDTEFFGVRVARALPRALTPRNIGPLLRECRRTRVECLYLDVDAGDSRSLAIAEAHGFLLVDVRVRLTRPLEGPIPRSAAGVEVAPPRAGDLPSLRRIARGVSRVSRYYHDRRFRQHAARLYGAWITKAWRESSGSVLVARLAQQPVGFLTTKSDGADGKIDLVGVSPNARGREVGLCLVAAALRRFRQGGLRGAEVLTQGRNVAALRLYGKAGFQVAGVSLFYHRWFR